MADSNQRVISCETRQPPSMDCNSALSPRDESQPDEAANQPNALLERGRPVAREGYTSELKSILFSCQESHIGQFYMEQDAAKKSQQYRPYPTITRRFDLPPKSPSDDETDDNDEIEDQNIDRISIDYKKKQSSQNQRRLSRTTLRKLFDPISAPKSKSNGNVKRTKERPSEASKFLSNLGLFEVDESCNHTMDALNAVNKSAITPKNTELGTRIRRSVEIRPVPSPSKTTFLALTPSSNSTKPKLSKFHSNSADYNDEEPCNFKMYGSRIRSATIHSPSGITQVCFDARSTDAESDSGSDDLDDDKQDEKESLEDRKPTPLVTFKLC